MKVKRDLFIVAGGRVVTAILGLLTIRAVTTFLSPEQYGQLALLVVVQSFCGLFLVNPVGQHINRHTHEWWEDGSLFTRFIGYRKYIFIVSLLGAFATLWVSRDFSWIQIVVVMLAMTLMINGNTWNATYIPLLNMVGQRGAAVNWALITSATGLLASVLFCLIWPTSVAWFIGQAVGFSLGAFGAGLVLRHGILPDQNNSAQTLISMKSVTNYCIPLALATGFMWLQLSGYRLVVEHYWGLYLLGFFAVGLSLAAQVWGLVETLAQQFLYPFFYRRIALADGKSSSQIILTSALSDLVNVMVPIYLVLIGITYVSAPYLVKLLLAHQYANAEVYLRLGIVLEFCRVVANLLSNAAQATKKTRSMILPYALGALVVIIMLVVSGECHFPITSAVISLGVAALVMLVTMWLVMSHEVKFHPDFKTWFISLLMMTMFILSAYLLPKPSSWLLAVIILGVVGLLGVVQLGFLFRNNASLQRLITVDLKGKNVAI